MEFKHDLKYLHCNVESGGCGIKYTIPPEHNKIHEEMRIHKKITHGYKPQVIDKKSKDLRDMTDPEHQEHLAHIKDVVDKELQKEQKAFPHNEMKIKEEIVNGMIHHTLEIEPVYGIIEGKLRDINEGTVFSEIHVKCPKCGKIGVTIHNAREIKDNLMKNSELMA